MSKAPFALSGTSPKFQKQEFRGRNIGISEGVKQIRGGKGEIKNVFVLAKPPESSSLLHLAGFGREDRAPTRCFWRAYAQFFGKSEGW